MKICYNCGSTKTRLNNLGYPHWRLKGGERYCKKCYCRIFEYTKEKKKYNTKYRKTHKTQMEVYCKNYYKNHNLDRNKLKTWSVHIRKRDGKCRLCWTKENLHAHHIVSKTSHPELYLNENNGITLCNKCHIWVHSLEVTNSSH